MKLKQVNTRQMIWALEDGSYERRRVTLYLDPTGTPEFVYKLPEHVAKSLGVDEEVRGPTAEDALEKWDRIIARFVEWYRTAKAELVIILEVAYYGETPEGDQLEEDSFFYTAGNHLRYESRRCVGVSYRLAFRVNGKIHYRERKWDGKKESFPVGPPERESNNVVLDYSEELHARLEAICGAVNRAANQLHQIVKAKDVAAMLMASKLPLLAAPEKK